MKKLAIFICIAGLVSCKKEYDSIYTYADKENTAKVKFVHALTNAMYSPKATATAPMQLYLGGTKITGANITAGAGVFPGLEWSLVSSGTLEFKALIPKTDTTAEQEAVKTQITLEAGQTYSLFVTDTLPTATVLLVKDEQLNAVADSGKYFIRYINLTPKSTGYDFYSTSDLQTVFTNVPYKGATEYKQLFVGTAARSLAIRKTGTTTNLLTSSLTPVAGRMYTVFSWGIDGGTGLRAIKAATYTSRFQTYTY
jgi:hypothetical protein